jgi:hypothetical protein
MMFTILCKSEYSVISQMYTTLQNELILWAQADSGHFSASQIQELYDASTEKACKLSLV